MPDLVSLLVLPAVAPEAGVLALAVAVALGLDRWLGEPPARLHPVVWMGSYLRAVGQRVAPSADQPTRPAVSFWLGVAGWGGGAILVVLVTMVLAAVLHQIPWGWQAVLLGVLLKPMLAWRMLRDEVMAVEQALADSLASGRERVGWLVSRDVRQMDEGQVREAAVSTLAENLNDSVVAPVFWFLVGGLPAAALYRFANTADAMWGYRGERGGRDWTWAGKWAARVDDVLSWVPARLTALLIALPTWLRGWPAIMACAGQTPSPNGGWPMGAMAVGLDIRLGKPGVYTLNAQGRQPLAADTSRALQRSGWVVLCLWLLAVGAVLVQGALS